MRKIIAGMFITLDRVVEAPEQWNPPHYDDELNKAVMPAFTDAELHLYGRRSYELSCAVFIGPGQPRRPSHGRALRSSMQFVRALTHRNGKYELANHASGAVDGAAEDPLSSQVERTSGEVGPFRDGRIAPH